MYRKRLKGYSAIGYRILSNDSQTLFNTTENLNLSSYEGQIFNGNTFRQPFTKELKASKRSIVISSPRLYHVERNVLVKSLATLQTDGIEVAVLTTAENEQTENLKNKGITFLLICKVESQNQG